MAKVLNEDYVNEVIGLVNDGYSNKEIAEMLNTKPANIQYVRNTHKERITFSRFKGGRVSKTINLPPVKEEKKEVYETVDVLMLAEKTVLIGGIKTALWYKLAGGKICIMSKDRQSGIEIESTQLRALVEELMRLSAVMPKFSVDNLEAY